MSTTSLPITNLEQLHWAATERRSVICPDSPAWNKPKAASFMLNLQGHLLRRLFRRGMYLYVK